MTVDTDNEGAAISRLSDHHHCDELCDMKHRLQGFYLAIRGAGEDLGDGDRDGLLQLSSDICERMEAIHSAFSAEYELRRAEKQS